MAINDLLNGMILQVAASPTYKLADLSHEWYNPLDEKIWVKPGFGGLMKRAKIYNPDIKTVGLIGILTNEWFLI